MKKKYLSYILSVAIIFGCTACAGQDTLSTESVQAVEYSEQSDAENKKNDKPLYGGGNSSYDNRTFEEKTNIESIKDSNAILNEKSKKVKAEYDIEKIGTVTSGVLSFMNMTELEYDLVFKARYLAKGLLEEEEYAAPDFGAGKLDALFEADKEIKYYDSLNMMLLGITSGDIDSIATYQCVADYITMRNDDMVVATDFSVSDNSSINSQFLLNTLFSNEFSLLLTEDNQELKEELDSVITEMKLDETLDRLIEEQIADVISEEDIDRIEPPKYIEGAETLQVAVTGDMPPMDYVAADGSPAGFNTAVLYEIGRRLGKNIEIVPIDGGARSTALSSGRVDAIFWTRTSDYLNTISDEFVKELYETLTEDQKQIVNELRDSFDLGDLSVMDIPDGTIATKPYFSDAFALIVSTELSNRLDAAKK